MKKVLFIEDDPEMLNSYRDYLAKVFQVDQAWNGEEGLSKLTKAPYDLVILDIMMPHMDGMRFLQLKNQNPAIAKVPVVVLSNLGNSVIVKQCLALGAKQYIPKAETSPDKIIPALKKVMEGSV